MNLGICCNFGPPSIGGSEYVIENVAVQLAKKYNYTVNIYGFNYSVPSIHRNLNLFPCKKGKHFISQISRNDHLFVYSDSFWGFDTILNNLDKIGCKISLSLVGAYHMRDHSPSSFELLRKNKEKFNIITHSDGPDYQWAIKNGLKVDIIPNGVNISEFRENNIDFRKKYKIKEKYILLNISNWFYGKGQEILPRIYQKLKEKLDDFVILQLSNTVKYPYDKIFLNRVKQQSKGMNIKFLRDLSREDVVGAFKASDAFLFSSKKEVCPLVILESRAAKLPFISMRVGDVEKHRGGFIIPISNKDEKGYVVVGDRIIKSFSSGICQLLKENRVRESLINGGQVDIEQIDWNNIVPLYHGVFSK